MFPVIDRAVQAGLITSDGQVMDVPAALRYRRDDPLAVRACFPPRASLGGADVTWVFSRDLLAAGLLEPVGDGDVHVRPFGPLVTVLEFHAAAGTALVRMDSADVRSFLEQTYALVPFGREELHLDLDGDLAALLREA
ncbi:SsgA family sporulation/cell division regulator [Streptomyces xinghaiensis]|uniref:SsgA family sporulation/cell division regulator n=1 Tax=Streptomyces xinghaiensis TaxID=1038928 RepID=UPI0002D29802|nr:SsgA family sporulation/cell division regulator [Streptomyces xinghaiensis]MZE75903.1 SsgA family sporulation/cell division regulator [Streptomyces sp. SID5475]